MSLDRWRLDGRVAVVLGARRGPGLGCARALAESGAKVLLVSRTASDIEPVARELGGSVTASVLMVDGGRTAW